MHPTCQPRTPSLVRRMMGVLPFVVLCLMFARPVSAGESGIPRLREQSNAFAELAERSKAPVVFISVEKEVDVPVRHRMQPSPFGDPFGDPFDMFPEDLFEHFFRRRPQRHPAPQERQPQRQRPRQQGQGSGFIITPDGYILTNNHVVDGADTIRVRLDDGREYEATLVGTDPQTDLAVIRIEAEGLPTLPLGDSDALRVGEWVMAIGNPFGFLQTVTVGVVSAKGRSGVGILDFEDFIQTDAAINMGNSGGPLLNIDGEVVGINTAIFSRSGGYMGIGFAIPVNMAKNVYEQLIATGKITRGFLGVMIQDLNADLAESFGLESQDGILISKVEAGSPAGEGGLQTGDVLLELNGNPIRSVGAFRNTVAMTPPGTEVTLVILRDGERIPLSIPLGTRDGTTAATGEEPTAHEANVGFSVQELTPDLARRFGYETDEGVLISNVERGSLAAMAGLSPGTLVMRVNRNPVGNVAEFNRQMADAVKQGRVLLLVKQNGMQRFVSFRIR